MPLGIPVTWDKFIELKQDTWGPRERQTCRRAEWPQDNRRRSNGNTPALGSIFILIKKLYLLFDLFDKSLFFIIL